MKIHLINMLTQQKEILTRMAFLIESAIYLLTQTSLDFTRDKYLIDLYKIFFFLFKTTIIIFFFFTQKLMCLIPSYILSLSFLTKLNYNYQTMQLIKTLTCEIIIVLN